MTAFNRPNTERSERLQIINRSDCYLESLPVQQQQAAILQSNFRKTSGNFLLVLSSLQSPDFTWGREGLTFLFPRWWWWWWWYSSLVIVQFTVRGRPGLAWSHSRQDNSVWPLTIILTLIMFHLTARIINNIRNQTNNTILQYTEPQCYCK